MAASGWDMGRPPARPLSGPHPGKGCTWEAHDQQVGPLRVVDHACGAMVIAIALAICHTPSGIHVVVAHQTQLAELVAGGLRVRGIQQVEVDGHGLAAGRRVGKTWGTRCRAHLTTTSTTKEDGYLPPVP